MTSTRWKRGLVTAGALLLGLAVAASSWAQGMFYKEIAKDGRVYVFNDAKKAEAFEKGGEMGTGITRIGVGPNGETVVADSEQALDLYFFKHGIALPVARPEPPVQRIEWRDGKTRFTLGKTFYMELSNRVQPRFTYEMPDDSVQLPGTPGKGDNKGSFTIRRAKMKFEGFIYKPELEFEVQLNWPDASTAQPNRFLEDANIDWDLTKGKKAFRIRFGQMKAPYGRQQLESSGAQQFVDRALNDGRYDPARETGLALWGTLGVNKLDWRAMISNGNGRSQATNDNDKFLYTARVMWQALGNTRMNQWGSGVLLTEGDLGDSQGHPLLAIAADFLNNNNFYSAAPPAVNLDNTQWGADYIFKYKGFSSLASYDHRKSKPQALANAAPGVEFTDEGILFQASFAWKAPGVAGAAFWELAFRYATIDPTDQKPGDDRKEIGGAVSYYYNRHNLKIQADYLNIKDDAANSGLGTSTNQFRLQTQFIF